MSGIFLQEGFPTSGNDIQVALLMTVLVYLLNHPEIEEKIPDNAMIVLLPEYDKELAAKNIELSEVNKEAGQQIVYVKVERLRASRIEGLTLQVA